MRLTPTADHGQPRSGMADVVGRNIRTLLARRQVEDRRAGWQDRLADRISGFTGSMRFVYLHLAIYGLWILANVPGVPLPHFDPTYVVLAMVASVEAIFLSTFILITQNRMAAQAERRAELDLQVSLLAEHEITRLITLVSAIAGRVGVDAAQDPELAELAQDVAPEKVLDTMEAHQQQMDEDGRRAKEP
ncbi:MAG TPA: DUF1003 domain-containing protein [Candidatus Tectomicrobia bacterium]|nr:DUF1003 domain-containing protein [Candidatus Tectomicrobia bacterium]